MPILAGVAHAEAASVAIVGRWKPSTVVAGTVPSASNTRLFVEPAGRVLYTYTNPGGFAAYDLDTLAPRGAALAAPGLVTLAAVDPVSRTLLVAFGDRPGGSSRLEQFVSAPGGVVRTASVDTTGIVGRGQEILGVHRPPDRDVLWAISGVPQGGNFTGVLDVTITELVLPGGDVSRATRNWSLPLPECQAGMHGNVDIPVALGYVAEQRALYFACGNTGAVRDAPSKRGAARLVLAESGPTGATTPGLFESFPVPGSFRTADTFFDPIGKRLLLTTLSNGTATIVVFDALTHTYIGTFAAGSNQVVAAALEPHTGRFYGLSNNPALGLMLSDVRATPVRQGYAFPSMGQVDGGGPASSHPAVDWRTSRLFLKYTGVPHFVLVEDQVPRYAVPPEDDLDRNTVDVEERPGRTSALFSGAAQAYGSRHRQVGGIDSLWNNVTGIGNMPWPAAKGTREVRTGYLDTLALSNSEASATAAGAERDDGTRDDLDGAPVGPWPYPRAGCTDFGDQPSEAASRGAVVACDAGRQLVRAEAVFDDGNVGPVRVGRATVEAFIRRELARGSVTKVTASASGIVVLDGLLEIGEVVAVAEAWAKGRPGTNGTRYDRVIRNVRVQGTEVCGDRCDTSTLAAELNARLKGRLHVAFPGPDGQAAAGSPGGYQALIRRSLTEHIEEQAFNGQPPDRLEVPAVVFTVYEDDAYSARTVTELAGVEAEARYGIAVLGDAADDGSADGEFADGTGSGLVADGLPGAVAGNAVELSSPLFGVAAGQPVGGVRRAPFSFAASDVATVTPAGVVWNGLRRMVELLPVWAVLLVPVYLSARRRLLLEREALAGRTA